MQSGIELAGVGVDQAPFLNFSVTRNFDFAKVYVRYIKSRSYLSGVSAAQLRRHLTNMNVITGNMYFDDSDKNGTITEWRELA